MKTRYSFRPIRRMVLAHLSVVLAAGLSACRKPDAPAEEAPASSQGRTEERQAASIPVQLPTTVDEPAEEPPVAAAPETPGAAHPEIAPELVDLYNRGVQAFRGDGGVPQNYREAAAIFREAAEKGHPGAQHNLGFLYLHGFGVPQDLEQGREWLLKSADQGIAEAQFKLASIYALGHGVPRDLAQTSVWARLAADQGHAGAAYNLATMYVSGQGVEQDFEAAVKWYRAAAEQGNVGAQSNLGVFYANGRGVEKDLGEAARWFKKAADQGHPTAQFNLGRAYADGQVFGKDLVEAYKWFSLAADQGDPEAEDARRELSLEMRASEMAEAARRVREFRIAMLEARQNEAQSERPAEGVISDQ